jgi:hypothetical protein
VTDATLGRNLDKNSKENNLLGRRFHETQVSWGLENEKGNRKQRINMGY